MNSGVNSQSPQPDGSAGARLYLATKDLFQRTAGTIPFGSGPKSGAGSGAAKASLRGKEGEGSRAPMHSKGSHERQTIKSLGRPLSAQSYTGSSKSKRTVVLMPSSAKSSSQHEYVESVTNPMYQHSDNDNLGANTFVPDDNLGVNSKSEQSDHNGSSLPGASTGVVNTYVPPNPLPSGLLPANEASATAASGTDSLEVMGTHPQSAPQSSPQLATLGALQLSTHEEHAPTSGDGDVDVLRNFKVPNLSINLPPRPKTAGSIFAIDNLPDAATRPGMASPAGTAPRSGSIFFDASSGVKSGVSLLGRSPRTPGGASTNPTLYHTFSTQHDGEAFDNVTPRYYPPSAAGGSSQLSYGVFSTPVHPENSAMNALSAFNTPRASIATPSDFAEDAEAPNAPKPPRPPSVAPEASTPEASAPEDSAHGSHASRKPSPSTSAAHSHALHGSHASGKSTSQQRSHPSHVSDNAKATVSSGGNTKTRNSAGNTKNSSGGNTRSGSVFLRSLKAGKVRFLGGASASTAAMSQSLDVGNPQAGNSGPSTRRDGSSRKCVLYGVRTLDSQPLSVSGTREVSPPPPGADMHDWKEYLNYQLDSLREFEFLGGLVMLFGPRTRLHGGQAVVQMCTERKSNRECAVKFFLSNSAFLDECKLYQDRENKPLGRFLPEVHRIINCPVEGYTDAYGVPLPPCIVMEKGESLDHWAARGGDGVDSVTGLQVLTHVAERLTDLHAAGYVHRDIKPGNVMWLPRKNRWTLIDFGCAARTGEKARKGFSFSYAAPEVLAAVKAGKQIFDVSEALDVWSIGILAIEMFTGSPVYSCLQTKQTTLAMVLGEEQAPWEHPESSKAIMKRLGHLRDAVLAALRRNPEERPSMSQFLRACHSVLNSTAETTITNTNACSVLALNGLTPGTEGGDQNPPAEGT